jgi:hypothetical protein
VAATGIMRILFILIGLTSANLSCRNLTGYYTGTFMDYQGSGAFTAQFEMQVRADRKFRQIVARFSKVNKEFTSPKIELHMFGQEGRPW